MLFSTLPAKGGEVEQNLSDLSVEGVQIVLNVEHIQLSFLVRDSEGNLIRNLSEADFTLFENGEPRRIAALQEQEVPINALVMVDTSWSLGRYFADAMTTGVEFFRGLQGERSAFLLFSEKPRVVLDWDEDPSGLASKLAGVRTDGRTALYDSVIWAARNLFGEKAGKKLIILVTDGIDTVSRKDFGEMIQATRAAGITIYSILYSNQILDRYREQIALPDYHPKKRYSSVFHDFMVVQNKFLEQSMRFGGRAVFSDQFADLRKGYAHIIEEMKSHYVLLYESELRSRDDVRQVTIDANEIPARIFVEISQ
jgi:VWFA-related protein